jgi:hypothetical protein
MNIATKLISLFAAATIAASFTGCASVPNKFAANVSDSPASRFCKAEAVKISARMAVSQSQSPALSGRTDTMELRERVLNDCLKNVKVVSH